MIQSHALESTSLNRVVLPDRVVISDATNEAVRQLLEREGGDLIRMPLMKDLKLDGLCVKQNFLQTAPIYYGESTDEHVHTLAVRRGNNQTDAYLEMLGLEHRVTIPYVPATSVETEIDANALDIDCCLDV